MEDAPDAEPILQPRAKNREKARGTVFAGLQIPVGVEQKLRVGVKFAVVFGVFEERTKIRRQWNVVPLHHGRRVGLVGFAEGRKGVEVGLRVKVGGELFIEFAVQSAEERPEV